MAKEEEEHILTKLHHVLKPFLLRRLKVMQSFKCANPLFLSSSLGYCLLSFTRILYPYWSITSISQYMYGYIHMLSRFPYLSLWCTYHPCSQIHWYYIYMYIPQSNLVQTDVELSIPPKKEVVLYAPLTHKVRITWIILCIVVMIMRLPNSLNNGTQRFDSCIHWFMFWAQ